MRVAYISQPLDGVLPPYQNSISILTQQIANRVARYNDVTIYGKKMRSQARDIEESKIRYRFVPGIPNRMVSKFSSFLARRNNPRKPFFASSLYGLDYILQIAYDLRSQKCDVVHLHNFSQFAPILRAFNPGIKIVLHMHCEWLTQLDVQMIERRLNDVDLVIGCSEYITTRIRRRYPQYAHRCQTILNGVDVDRFSRQENHRDTRKGESFTILFVGRLSPEKGVHVLLDAFQEVAQQVPQAKLIIVGPPGELPPEFLVLLSDEDKVSQLVSHYVTGGKRKNYLAELRKSLTPDSSRRVSFTGPVSHSQINHYYRDADIFVNASVWEPSGMPILEAMASGLPVIASRVGGIPEAVVDKKTGILFEAGNATELAEAILSLSKDENRMMSMGFEGRKRVANLYSWDSLADDWLQHYHALC